MRQSSLHAVERSMQKMLLEIDPESRAAGELREGISGTPARVAKMYNEYLSGYETVPEDLLSKTFSDDVIERYDGMVIIRDIPVFSLCEHHLLPFFGVCHIGYIPSDGSVPGLSKFARLVEAFSRRLQIQERLTQQILDAIMEGLGPRGCAVLVEATHTCMIARGARAIGSLTVTSALGGFFLERPHVKQEFLDLLSRERRSLC